MNTRRQRIRRIIIAALFLALPVTLNYYSPYLMTQGTAERVATFSLARSTGCSSCGRASGCGRSNEYDSSRS